MNEYQHNMAEITAQLDRYHLYLFIIVATLFVVYRWYFHRWQRWALLGLAGVVVLGLAEGVISW